MQQQQPRPARATAFFQGEERLLGIRHGIAHHQHSPRILPGVIERSELLDQAPRPAGVVRAREHVDYRAMLVRDHIGALTAMYDRNVLGTRLMPEMRKRQDYALLLSIMRDGAEARALAEPLAVYRAHQAGSLSSNKLSLVQYNWALYREHEHLPVPRATRALVGAVWQSLRNSRI